MADKKPLLKRLWRRAMPVVIPPVGGVLIRLLSFTMSKKVVGLGAIRADMDAGKGVIIAFWHGKMLMLPAFYDRYLQREAHVLISQHRDGELISRAIGFFGIDSIRGSSTRGGQDALVKLIAKLRAGAIIGITPDGPKGPGEKARRGAIELAHVTGAPIYPLSFAASRQKKLNSWDKFAVPGFFSKAVFVLGDPLYVKSDEDMEGREMLRVELERRLNEAGLEAERLAGWATK